ncbi:MAG: transposase [Oligoflexus sp.]|nr:transposase [Oligoflexus sp.]
MGVFISQECSSCNCTHPRNRKSQESFVCGSCGHAENADIQTAKVIKKRAIGLILNAGSALSERGVLLSVTGRGAAVKTKRTKVRGASGKETSNKTRQDSRVLPSGFVLEASPL